MSNSAAAAAPAPRSPDVRDSIAYVAPFAAFIAGLTIQQAFPDATLELHLVRAAVVTALLATVSRRAIPLRPVMPLLSVLVGVAVFGVWVAPDLLWPGYRGHWLFENPLTGAAASSIPAPLRTDALFLALRAGSSILLVPVLEELFWRGWLMRWLVRQPFLSVPPGTYTATSFWTVALLFASEHGSYWDVGLAAGIAFNWWLVRTRNLADCILAHAAANACLAAWVLLGGHWQFWL